MSVLARHSLRPSALTKIVLALEEHSEPLLRRLGASAISTIRPGAAAPGRSTGLRTAISDTIGPQSHAARFAERDGSARQSCDGRPGRLTGTSNQPNPRLRWRDQMRVMGRVLTLLSPETDRALSCAC